MRSNNWSARDVGMPLLAAALLAGLSSSPVLAQAGINPDGSMWVNTPSGSTWTNPAGSVKLDKEGHVVDVIPTCENVRSISVQNVQQAKSVCWKRGNKYEVYVGGYVLYTCFDHDVSVARRITSYVQATGRPCDPADEAIDRGSAQADWQETWLVDTNPFPQGDGHASTGDGTQTGNGTQTATGTQTGSGTQPGNNTPPGSNTPGNGQTANGGTIPPGWPPGADVIRADVGGGWTIHYPNGRTVKQKTDGTMVELTPPGSENVAPTNTNNSTGTHPNEAHSPGKGSKKPKHSVKKSSTRKTAKQSAEPHDAGGAVQLGIGFGVGTGHGFRGGREHESERSHSFSRDR